MCTRYRFYAWRFYDINTWPIYVYIYTSWEDVILLQGHTIIPNNFHSLHPTPKAFCFALSINILQMCGVRRSLHKVTSKPQHTKRKTLNELILALRVPNGLHLSMNLMSNNCSAYVPSSRSSLLYQMNNVRISWSSDDSGRACAR